MTAQPEILIVDDEPIVLAALRETLERGGYAVVACTSPVKAPVSFSQQSAASCIAIVRANCGGHSPVFVMRVT